MLHSIVAGIFAQLGLVKQAFTNTNSFLPSRSHFQKLKNIKNSKFPCLEKSKISYSIKLKYNFFI